MKKILFIVFVFFLLTPQEVAAKIAVTRENGTLVPAGLGSNAVKPGIFQWKPSANGFFPLVSYNLAARFPRLTTYTFGSGANNQEDGYLYIIYRYGIQLVIILTVGQIIYGGITYVTSASGYVKNDGKERIQEALKGLALALGSYLILRTINPDLVKLELKITPINVKQRSGSEQRPFIGPLMAKKTPDQLEASVKSTVTSEAEKTVRNTLRSATITVNNPMCPEGKSFKQVKEETGVGCTSVADLSPISIGGALRIRGECLGCGLTITGGTELGHKEHWDTNTVDFAKNGTLDTYIKQEFTRIQGTNAKPEKVPSGIQYNTYWFRAVDEGDHWHIEFKPAAIQK